MGTSGEKITLEPRPVCQRCVLCENIPDIWLDKEGICNVCRDFEKQKEDRQQAKLLESDFIKILNQNKGSGKYDCLVMCSGGKDSTAALYYMKKRYKRNPLAFTFDQGFETKEALENVNNAVDILGVDFLYYKTSYMKKMFAQIIESSDKTVPCHPCSMWYMGLTFEMAARYDIPLIVAGWTKGQSSSQPVMSRCGCNVHQPEFKSMSQATRTFLDKYTKEEEQYKDFPKSMEEVLTTAKKKHKATVVSPHWFLPADSSEYVEILQKELNWKYPSVSYPGLSTNCSMNFFSVRNSLKNFGYTHYHVEMSKMIREGMMSRDEALKLLEVNFDQGVLDGVMQKLRGSAGAVS